MKAKIHPTYHSEILITCGSCGTNFKAGSTKEVIHVEVCYKCHPFYTGEHRFLDVKGRVDEFQKKQEVAKQYKASMQSKKQKQQNQEKKSKSLKELLSEA